MTHSPRLYYRECHILTYPHLAEASSSPVVRLFCQKTRPADAAMQIDDVVVWVDAVESSI